MPGPYLPGLTRISVLYTDVDYGSVSNVFHVDRGSAGLPFALGDFKAAFDTLWGHLRVDFSSRLVLGSYQAQDLSEPDGQVAELPTSAVSPLGNDAERLPPDLAIVASWRSGQNGRRGRGRTYFGALGLGTLDPIDGTINTSTTTRIQTRCAEFLTALDQADSPLVVYSRVGAGLMTPITSVQCDFHWDVQRRRGN